MHQTRNALVLASIAFALVACATQQQSVNSETCSLDALSKTNDPNTLRSIASKCVDAPGVGSVALSKLNDLPPPNSPRLKPNTPASIQSPLRVAYLADIFFDRLESYPIDDQFAKLNDLISKMNSSDVVISIDLRGGADEDEMKLLPTNNIARKRAEFVHRYFRAAGLDQATRVEVVEVGPRFGDTLENRAKDRLVEVDIFTERKLPVSK